MNKSYRFVDAEHEAFFLQHSDITSRGKDYQALVYTLGISRSCRDHFSDLYDADKRLIKTDGLEKGWQTGSSIKITRLAFNLFTYRIPESDDKAYLYSPIELLSGLDQKTLQGALWAIAYFV